jgi:hypothetical protein
MPFPTVPYVYCARCTRRTIAQVLASQVRAKLRCHCASELETLASGVPGNYVILPSSSNEPQMVSGASNSTAAARSAAVPTAAGARASVNAAVAGNSSVCVVISRQARPGPGPNPVSIVCDPAERLSPLASDSLADLVRPSPGHSPGCGRAHTTASFLATQKDWAAAERRAGTLAVRAV